MRDDAEQARLLRTFVTTPWTPTRAQAVKQAVVRKRLRVRRQRAIGASVLAACLVAGVWWTAQPTTKLTADPPLLAQPSPQRSIIRLPDGSTMTALKENLAVLDQVERVDGDRVWRFVGGSVRFAIAARSSEPFMVRTRHATLSVMGAVFVVQDAGDQPRLTVEAGEVQVSLPASQERVYAGQSAQLTPEEDPASLPAAAPKASKSPSRPQRWQGLVRRGRYDEAFVALEKAIAIEGSAAVPDEPGSLLLAADAARLSKHPDKALPHLQRFVRRFPSDPRSSLAAFTLGLVLLEELGRPHEAAHAFAKSRQMSPTGDLAEDALGREAEAFYRAGDEMGARAAAAEYLRRFPSGRRAGAVKRFGALE